MPKLILTLDGAVIREYSIDKDSISIGRKHGNDIQLNDLTISGRHSLITKVGDNVFIDDLGSTNGSLLNGARVAKSKLQHSDVIQIGNYQFTFFSQDEEDYEPTMFLRAEIEDTKIIDTKQKPTTENTGAKLGAVKVLSGPLKGKVLELRKPFNTLGFNGAKMAIIARNSTDYTITAIKNEDSINVAMVNSHDISTDALELKEHDIIELANTQIEFIFID